MYFSALETLEYGGLKMTKRPPMGNEAPKNNEKKG